MVEEEWDSGMEGPATEKQYIAWEECELYCQKVSSFGGGYGRPLLIVSLFFKK